MNELAALFEGQIGQEIWLMLKMLTSEYEVELVRQSQHRSQAICG